MHIHIRINMNIYMPVDRCYVPCAEESSYYKKHLQKKC